MTYAVKVSWFWLKRSEGKRELRFVAFTYPYSGAYLVQLGRKRWAIEGFFKTAKHRFGLHRFGQATKLGVDRWLVLSFILLIFPPTIQLLVYGFALNPDVHFIKLGVVDYARSYESRELVSAFTENRIFTLAQTLNSEKELRQQVEQGKITAGVVIPPEFNRDLSWLNPLRHYVAIMRGILLKGVGLESLWLHAISLAVFAFVLLAISTRQFRRQLS